MTFIKLLTNIVLFCYCRYIKVVGTHNTVNRVFHVVALEALYTLAPFTLKDGLIGMINMLDVPEWLHEHDAVLNVFKYKS